MFLFEILPFCDADVCGDEADLLSLLDADAGLIPIFDCANLRSFIYSEMEVRLYLEGSSFCKVDEVVSLYGDDVDLRS